MENIRKDELQRIIEIIRKNPYGKIIITGDPGSGKSFLLNMVRMELNKQGQKTLYDNMLYTHKSISIQESQGTVCLIDGLDEIYINKKIIENIKHEKGCYICTSRENKYDIKFDYEIKLKPLDNNQVLLLIRDYLGESLSSEKMIKEIMKLDKQRRMPREIVNLLHTGFNKESFSNYLLGLRHDVYQLYSYKRGVSLQQPEIVIPDHSIVKVPNELKNDITVIRKSLIDKVAIRPEILQEITSRQFEELVCELFDRKGYNVQLTKQTRDGGKDLIVLSNNLMGEFVIYAECKQRAKQNPIGVGLVRQLYGTIQADNATAGIMITNSYFSKDAYKFQKTIKTRMTLIDYSELMMHIMNC